MASGHTGFQVCVCVCVCVPVQLEGQGPVDGGEAQQADPSQEDTAEYAGLEVEDPDLGRGGGRRQEVKRGRKK